VTEGFAFGLAVHVAVAHFVASCAGFVLDEWVDAETGVLGALAFAKRRRSAHRPALKIAKFALLVTRPVTVARLVARGATVALFPRSDAFRVRSAFPFAERCSSADDTAFVAILGASVIACIRHNDTEAHKADNQNLEDESHLGHSKQRLVE